MSRGVGTFELLRDLVPEWGAVTLALLTQLGDNWFIILLLLALYWIDARHRNDIAIVGGIWLAGVGVYSGLKYWFGLPRPGVELLDPTLLPTVVQPVYTSTAFASGFGFPSGHAVNVTIVYLGLAHVLSVRTARIRYAMASAVVVTVSLTRVALGLHYLVDVVVGVAIGIGLLVVVVGLWSWRPSDAGTIAFGLAILAGGFAVLTSDGAWNAVMVLAAAMGGFAGWQLLLAGQRIVRRESWQLDRPLVGRLALAGAAIAALVAALIVLVIGAFLPLRFPVDLVMYATAGAVGLATASLVVAPFGLARRANRSVAVGIENGR